jgi:hypothetical protein
VVLAAVDDFVVRVNHRPLVEKNVLIVVRTGSILPAPRSGASERTTEGAPTQCRVR